MAQIQKYRMPLNIDATSVYISETSDTESQYFGIQNIPDQFHAGKNYFLISGTNKLEPGTTVLIEVKDSNGHVIYHETPDSLIAGISRIVIVFVYPTTSIGMATITILGQSNVSIIPASWKNKFNVKWTRKINVNTLLGDITTPVFKEIPQLKVSELYDTSQSQDYIYIPSVLAANVYANGITGTTNGNKESNAYYYVELHSGSFTSDMEDGTLFIQYPSASLIDTNNQVPPPFSTKIFKVMNSRLAQVSPGYLFSETGKVRNFLPIDIPTPSSYVLNYTIKVPNTGSINKRVSYLNVRIEKLETYVGAIKYVDLYKQPGSVFIGRYPVQPSEMIVSGNVDALPDFYTHWKVISGSTPATFSQDDYSLLNSIKVNGAV